MFRSLALALTLTLTAAAAQAQAQGRAPIDRLVDSLGLREVVAIMHQEGVDYGAEMEDQMFSGRGGPSWAATVQRIYDTDRMLTAVRDTMDQELGGTDLSPLIAFFDSDAGQRIIGLEISARRALMDDDVEAAAADRVADMRSRNDPRLRLLDRFAEANDLIELNVMGGMNSSYAFYRGLADGAALPGAMTDEAILAEVWAQEPQIREDTTVWVYSFLAMAYQPLSDAEFRAYIELSKTDEGQDLNRALFSAFDTMYNDISRAMGVAAAQFVKGEDI